MTETTIYTKGSDGWSGETKIPLGTARPGSGASYLPEFLVITTHKAMQGGIYASANVRAEGFGIVTFEIGGDFSKMLLRDRKARCTEKTVTAMHEQALQQKAELLDEVKAFYAKKQAA